MSFAIQPSILHIDTGKRFRGGQRQVQLLAQTLRDQGVQQAVAAPRVGEICQRLPDIPGFDVPAHPILQRLSLKRLLRFLQHHRINLIHAHDSRAHSLALTLKRTMPSLRVIISRRVIFAPSSRFSRRFKYRGPVDHYIAISQAVAGTLRKIGVAEDKIAIIPSGLDLSAVTKAVEAPQWFTDIQKKYRYCIVSAGALTAEKAFNVMIYMMDRIRNTHPDVALIIMGDGPLEDSLTVLIKKLKLDTVFLPGHVEPLSSVFQHADLFVLTSRSEGLNTSAIEAAACGLPLVTTDVGGLPEIVSDGQNGALCPADDLNAFTRAAVSIVEDDSLRQKMARASREIAGKFDIRITAEKTLAVYRDILTAKE